MNDTRIYVGNLPFKTTDDELKKLFLQFGEVKSADVIRYKESGRSKGYAFVVVDEKAAEKALEQLNDNEYEKRVLKVRIAKPRENFPNSQKTVSDNSEEINTGIE
ncbi:RNA-binding protein [bacterium]|nr:RNA-binding protein [bacterium]